MRQRKLVIALVPAVIVAAIVPFLSAQMAPTATPEHGELLQAVGEWEGTLTAFMPQVPPQAMKATETVTAVGKLWTHARFECDFMGMPYVGTGVLGYDHEKKMMRGTWVDSMGTHLAVMEGDIDVETHTVNMRWQSPGMDGSMVAHRSVTVRTESEYTSTFYMDDGQGGEMKVMVIEMTKKGSKKSDGTMKPKLEKEPKQKEKPKLGGSR